VDPHWLILGAIQTLFAIAQFVTIVRPIKFLDRIRWPFGGDVVDRDMEFGCGWQIVNGLLMLAVGLVLLAIGFTDN
jgi:hypothetical protein